MASKVRPIRNSVVRKKKVTRFSSNDFDLSTMKMNQHVTMISRIEPTVMYTSEARGPNAG